MEAIEEKPAELYDFLYKDERRIASWSAQLFAGRTTNIERSNSETETETSASKVGFSQALGLDLTKATANAKGRRDTIDPHDMATVEVMSHLVNEDILTGDIEKAINGKVVLFQGEFAVIDGSTLKLASSFIDSQIKELSRQKRQPNIANTIETLTGVSRLIAGLQFPSAFLMTSDSGCQIGGTLREDGMQEPIASYYFKHALGSLSSVFCLGVKEVANHDTQIRFTQVFSTTQSLTKEISKLIFTEDTIRVMPLAIFRKLA